MIRWDFSSAGFDPLVFSSVGFDPLVFLIVWGFWSVDCAGWLTRTHGRCCHTRFFFKRLESRVATAGHPCLSGVRFPKCKDAVCGMIERARALAALKAALARNPVAMLLGPRECGKTTLAR
ncbi:MAG: hypothetical protein N3I86_00390 [Verrucomicrobiae bacterium]|nr:hypothetical protein [Verrucomicrobiae bacterium]